MQGKNKYFSSFIWRLLERFGAQGVTLIVSIILARLLDPDVYGIVAIITVFISILNILMDGGFGNALIQKKEADDVDFSTIFYFNVAFSLVLYALVFFLAPLIEHFYNFEGLTSIVRVIGLGIPIAGVKNIQQAYVARNMLFRQFFFATMGGTIGAAIIGIIMAYNGYGVWALIAQYVFNMLIDTIILWVVVPWRPIKAFSREKLKRLFSFGKNILVSNLIYNGYYEIRQLLIGKFYSSADLAYYNQGYRYPYVISSNINTSIDSILFPAMSSVQEDVIHVKEMLRKSILLSQFVVGPCVIGLAACAGPIVQLLLTDKWLPCVPYMQLFCISMAFGQIGNANQSAIMSVGRSDIKLKIEIIKTILDVAILFGTIFISPIAVAIGFSVGALLRIAVCAWPNKRILGYSFVNQMKDVLPNLIITYAMGIIVWLVTLFHMSPIITLLIQIPLGIMIYIGISVIMKNESFFYILDIVKSYRKRGTKND